MEELLAGKPGNAGKPVELLFAGRFLPLKHPEYALLLAKKLSDAGIPFHLTMAGGGEMEAALRRQTAGYGLSGQVHFAGYRRPGQGRTLMEQADIFLMTSNYLEGWGAVLNEAMNSGCAVIADAMAGAVPFLLRHEKNGMVYRDGDREEFLRYGLRLAKDAPLRRALAGNAYDTIVGLWNPSNAADSLLAFAEGIVEGRPAVNAEGPLSPAPVIAPGQGYAYTRR